MFDFAELEGTLAAEEASSWQLMTLADVECQVLLPPGGRGSVESAVVFLHGGGDPWRIEQQHIFTPERTRLLAPGTCVILPASPMRSGSCHFWYSTDSAAVASLLQRAKQQESSAVEAADAQEPLAVRPGSKAELRHGTGGPENADAQSGPVPPPTVSPLEALKDGEPMLLDVSRATALRLLAVLESEWDVPCERIVLAGFSQGAALAMDTSLHLLPRCPAAVGFFSGSLMCRRRWRGCLEAAPEEARKTWRELPLLQAHGTGDWAVGVNGGRWLHTFCKEDVLMQRAEYIEFKGGHTVPPEVADSFAKLAVAALEARGDAR